jgi:NAD+ diphosphatase
MQCTECHNIVYPRISPAVIVAVMDGNRILMTKYAGRVFKKYALIAGYAEIGETLEETVRREVMEEVGLKVKNIRYYKSQPWAFDDSLLSGFFCELDGLKEIKCQTFQLDYL